MEWPATDVVGADGWHYQLKGDHGGGDRCLDQGRKDGAVMKRPMTLQRRKFLSAAAGADAVRGRMCVFLNERKADRGRITGWLKGKITTSRIHDFAEKYPPLVYDWLLCGDLKGLLRMKNGNPHGAPSPVPQQKPDLQKLLDTFSPPQMAAVAQLLEALNQPSN